MHHTKPRWSAAGRIAVATLVLLAALGHVVATTPDSRRPPLATALECTLERLPAGIVFIDEAAMRTHAEMIVTQEQWLREIDLQLTVLTRRLVDIDAHPDHYFPGDRTETAELISIYRELQRNIFITQHVQKSSFMVHYAHYQNTIGV